MGSSGHVGNLCQNAYLATYYSGTDDEGRVLVLKNHRQ